MGLRGPLRDPNSTRGIVENHRNPVEVVQERIQPPSWLKPKPKLFFIDVIDRQIAAGVGVRLADAETYARYADYSIRFRTARDVDTSTKLQRELSKLEAQLSIGEKERKRLGLKVKKSDTNPMAQLVRMPTGTDDIRRD
jgi:hypothetical protein